MARLWTITLVAETWHVLPSVAARELDDDPEQLSLECIDLLLYSQAYRAYKNAKNEKALEPWKGSKLMEAVVTNAAALHKARVAARAALEAAKPKTPKRKGGA